MFERVLVANRGEIAVRIIRACKELGIETVAIYSEADQDALHVRLADAAVCVGPGPVSRSYLNIPNIISAALNAEVDALHPGYGMLSERAQFAEICETHGIKFIGPSSATIELMGDKAQAKQTMRDAGVPVVPGGDGVVADEAQAIAVAEEIGYPVLIKAAAGGGGRGMRVAHSRAELSRLLVPAQAEAEASFGRPDVYIEKLLDNPRHIEVQVFADEHGHVVHLGERECSLQRRHQKVLEEAPAPRISDDLRRRMGEMSVRGARHVGYVGAGTMEYLVDSSGRFYFMEMNTRIQVEHTVTEMVTGLDLVKEQILVAAGEELSFTQEDVVIRGHALQCRINAEDPDRDFIPSPGTIRFYHAPGGPGVRVDSAAFTGCVVPPFYDSLLAKLVCHGPTREAAIARMLAALDEFFIEGVATTIPFHRRLLNDEAFRQALLSTRFLEQYMTGGTDGVRTT